MPSEYDVCRAWHGGDFRHGLTTVSGQPLTVIFPGTWTHNFGPDFHGALVAFGQELRRGDVEVHLRSSGWTAHGHDTDPAYNGVMLHVVIADDGAHCSTAQGRDVPATVLPLDYARETVTGVERAPSLAEMPCAARAPVERFPELLASLERIGDAWLAAKVARMEGALAVDPPAQVLYTGLLEGLGYSRNVEPMRRVASLAPLGCLESRDAGRGSTWLAFAAVLLGAGGLLDRPAFLASAMLTADEMRQLRDGWEAYAAAYGAEQLPGHLWTRARLRPSNYPERRLLGLAVLLDRCQPGGLLAAVRDLLLGDQSTSGARRIRRFIRGADSAARWPLGQDRADQLAVNVLIPFALAYGSWNDEELLVEVASRLWDRYPATARNGPVDRFIAQVGGADLRLTMARQHQGALAVYRQLCEQRRCYECPLARLSRSWP